MMGEIMRFCIDEYCRMGEIEDLGTMRQEYMRRLLKMSAILC